MHRQLPFLERSSTCPARRPPQPRGHRGVGVFATFLTLLALASPAAPVVAADRVLDRFPFVVQAGISLPFADLGDGSLGEPVTSDGALILPDLPFDPARGYGYIGGQASARSRTVALGGDPSWPLAWREDPRRYAFRLPNASYLLSLSFLETDVAVEGARRFDLLVEGETWLDGLDIVAEAGDFRWLTIERRVPVRDGWLDLQFVPRDDSLPPRISRLRLRPVPDVPEPLAAPAPEARAEPGAVRLVWRRPISGGVVGYGVFRAIAPEGPFESLTPRPLWAESFVDRSLKAGQVGYYRLRAYGVSGDQSPFSPVVESAPRPLPAGSLSIYGLDIAPLARTRLGVRKQPPPEERAEFLVHGRRYPSTLRAITELDEWHFRKSYRLDLLEGDYRDRRSFLLLAEAGDATFLRERLFHRLHDHLDLAAPRARHVQLMDGDRYAGVYLDREVLDRRFRKRAKLDTLGDFATLRRGGHLRTTWEPPGEAMGAEGGLWELTLLVHELNRINESEIETYVTETFYLDRLLTRLAAAAICGRNPGEIEPRVFLGDSRNGRWEYFSARAPEGAFGLASFRSPRGGNLDPVALHWSLFGPSLRDAGLPPARWHILETRLLNRPDLRERYLDRVEALCRGALSPAAVRPLVETVHEEIADAVLAGARPWPGGGAEIFRRGPEEILEFHEAQVAAVLRVVDEERRRSPEPLVLNEILLRPATPGDGETADAPWVEVVNRSGDPVDLGRYRLTTDPSRPTVWSFPAGALAPGQLRVVRLDRGGTGRLDAPLEASPDGGRLLLVHVDRSGRARVGDALFYGHQTAGFSLGRVGEDGAWGFLADPTPGEANRGPVAAPPPWRYRWQIEAEKAGGLTLSVRPRGDVAGVRLMMRFPDSARFVPHDLQWSESKFRYELTLPRVDPDQDYPFYFLARSADGVERPYPLTGPELTFRLPSRPRIFINEVLPRPSESNPHGEFVEIYNDEDFPVSIRDMFLSDSRVNSVKWRIPVSEPLPPKGFAVVYADGLGRGLHAPFRLGNSGEFLGLFHRLEAGNIRLDGIVFNAVPLDQSWGRRKDGRKGGRFWKDPTPGARNLPRIPEEYLRPPQEDDERGPDGEGDD